MIDYEEFSSAVGLNWYEVDPNLQQTMRRMLAPQDLEWAEPELYRLGALIGGKVAASAEVIDKNPPRLVQYDRSGERIDQIVHHPATLEVKRALWEAGVSGPRLRNEAARRGRPYPAVLATALNYMLAQADTGMLCAVGMTSGVITLVKRYAPPELREKLLARLCAEDFSQAADGAMFLTERTGGSDLGALTTEARYEDGRWLLWGEKWFCSNVDAALIATLARPQGAPQGIKGVALFLVPRLRADGSRNAIRIRRLKDKLGTRSVPTGEVEFEGAEAYLLAGQAHDGAVDDAQALARDGRGINRMMDMVNPSRHGVAVMGLGIMRRAFLEAAIYAARRLAFGRRLDALPMVQKQLARMVVELEAASALVFAGADSSPAARILIPLAKLRATRQGVAHASQALELHGGNGYIEDWPTARLLRDAQCHPIWEGTENIICLDVLRAMRAEGSVAALFEMVGERLSQARDFAPLQASCQLIEPAAQQARAAIDFAAKAERDLIQARAPLLANYLADLASAALLLEEAVFELKSEGSARKALIAYLFAQSRFANLPARGLFAKAELELAFFEELSRFGKLDPARLVRTLEQNGA